MSHMPHVHLVGAGPGAADLLTVRAARLIGTADIIFHDALVDADVLALAPATATLVPVGKRCGRLSHAQAFINKQLVDAAHRYGVVVRLKGGDPMLFGRAQEEIQSLAQAGVTVSVVPGISAAFGAAAALQQSLTQRGLSRSVCFLTPAVGRGEHGHDWARAALNADTAVLYMASRQAGDISAGLLAVGIPAERPAVLIESATLPGERILTTNVAGLPRAAAQLGEGPALMLIGDVYASLALRAELGARTEGMRGAA